MSTKKHVQSCLGRLREQYHELFTVDIDQWAKLVTSHHEKLRKSAAEDVEEACEQAPLKYPSTFPTVPQLANLVAACARERNERARRQAAEEREEAENQRIRETVAEKRRSIIPDSVAARERWVAEGTTETEKLARFFEAESKSLDLDPTKPCPKDVHDQRLRLLGSVLERIGRPQQQPPTEGTETAA